MATTAQLRAALAVLRADTDEAAEQARLSDMSGTDSAAVEHALLAGLLYRMMGDDLRHSLTGAPDLTALEERARAAGPGTATYATDDREQREEHCAQAHFEAYWLAHRIAGLHFTTVPSAPALQAAAHTAEATRTLLRIHRDLLDAPDAGHPAWEVVIDQLDRARALARTAYAGAEPLGAPPSETQPPETQPPETQPPETQPSETRPPEAGVGVSEIGVERSTECRTP